MSKRRYAAASVLVAACAGVPYARAQTPGAKEITIATGWGVPFHGETNWGAS